MSGSAYTPQVVDRLCGDFEEFTVRARGWDLDFLQLDRGEFRSELFQVVSDSAQVGRATYNRVLDQRGATPPGLRTFAVLSEGSSPFTWRHQEVPPSGVMIYPKGSEIDGVSRPGFDGYALAFSEVLLAEVAETAGFPDPETLTEGAEIASCAPASLLSLRSALRRLQRLAAPAQWRPLGPALRHELEFEMPRRLLTALASASGDAVGARPPNRNRNRLLMRVREYVETFADERLTVRQLCRAADVSERTLQYTFLEHFGVSPKAYLREYRLNRVRRELHAAGPSETTVIAVANRWGFWHMGQFSADYRRLFGERPSDTLRRRGRELVAM